ncbi:MAG: hypothetical protein FWC72_05870 [Oscillospiraceae bacterium]|nr:hypothetical protein [Oscillospiraceae bacterium]
MSQPISQKLLEYIGQINDFFVEEAETADIRQAKIARRKRIAKYGAYGAAGLAVSMGAVAAVWKIRSNRIAKSA